MCAGRTLGNSRKGLIPKIGLLSECILELETPA